MGKIIIYGKMYYTIIYRIALNADYMLSTVIEASIVKF